MPKLLSANVKELELPSGDPNDPIVVKLDATAYGGIMEDAIDPVTQEIRVTSGPIAKALITWNLTDESGQPAEINADNVRRLPPEALRMLAEELFSQLSVAIELNPVVDAQEKKV